MKEVFARIVAAAAGTPIPAEVQISSGIESYPPGRGRSPHQTTRVGSSSRPTTQGERPAESVPTAPWRDATSFPKGMSATMVLPQLCLAGSIRPSSTPRRRPATPIPLHRLSPATSASSSRATAWTTATPHAAWATKARCGALSANTPSSSQAISAISSSSRQVDVRAGGQITVRRPRLLGMGDQKGHLLAPRYCAPAWFCLLRG